MNYGYAAGREPLALDPADEPDRFCIQLYAHVLDGVDVTGTDVLEVGSGRGGGASWISRSLAPSTTTGVDFAVVGGRPVPPGPHRPGSAVRAAATRRRCRSRTRRSTSS